MHPSLIIFCFTVLVYLSSSVPCILQNDIKINDGRELAIFELDKLTFFRAYLAHMNVNNGVGHFEFDRVHIFQGISLPETAFFVLLLWSRYLARFARQGLPIFSSML